MAPHASDSWWEVEIIGDPHGLSLARDVLSGGSKRLVRDEDRHILTNRDWDRIPDASEVRSHARELVSSLAGSVRLAFGWPAPLQVGHVTRRHPDGRCDYFLEVDSARIEIKAFPVTLSITRVDGTTETHGPAEDVARWLVAAEGSELVRRVLRLIETPDLGWGELYHIADGILGAAGGAMFEWVPKKRFETFKRTANSLAAVGDEARHGQERYDPPPEPMTLSDARSLIADLARGWLTSLGADDADE